MGGRRAFHHRFCKEETLAWHGRGRTIRCDGRFYEVGGVLREVCFFSLSRLGICATVRNETKLSTALDHFLLFLREGDGLLRLEERTEDGVCATA